MKNIRRVLAFLLTAAMLTTAMPATAWAETVGELGGEVTSGQSETIDSTAREHEDFVAYNTGSGEDGYVLVVWEAFAEEYRALLEDENPVYSDVQTFSEDGSYTVTLAKDTTFPCAIVFQYMPENEDDEGAAIVEFADAEDTHEVRGHLFRVALDENGSSTGGDFNSGSDPLSYQQITTVTKEEVDLSDLFKEELKEVKLSTLLPGVNFTAGQKIAVDPKYVADSGGDGSYTVVTVGTDKDATIDLSSLWENDQYSGRYDKKVEILDKADQFDKETTRYIVPVQVRSSTGVWTFNSYDTKGEEAGSEYINRHTGDCRVTIRRDDIAPWDINAMPLSMGYGYAITQDEKPGLTVEVYKGKFDSLKAITDAQADPITGKIWSPNKASYTVDWSYITSYLWSQTTETENFTFVLKRKDTKELAYIESFSVNVDLNNPSFYFSLYTATDKTPISVVKSNPDMDSYYSNGKYQRSYNLQPADYTNWQPGNATLKMRWVDSQIGSEADVKIYAGYYNTVEALQTAKPTEVSDLWGTDNAGHTADYTDSANRQTFTIAVMKGDDVVWVYPLAVSVQVARRTNAETVRFYGRALNIPDDPYYSYYAQVSDSTNYIYWNIPEQYLNGTYNLSLSTTDSDSSSADNGYSKIKKIVWGAYDSETAAEGQTDIKDNLNNLEVNFQGQPVVFTVFYKDGSSEQIRLRLLPADPYERISGSTDTYFRLERIKEHSNLYILPPHADSSYSNGFQTLFVLDDQGKGLAEKSDITGEFVTGPGVRMYRDHDEAGVRLNMQGETEDPISFENGKALRYSAASESGTHLRNYWITLLTQQSGAKLWVNGQNDTDHATNGVPTREIFISYRGGYHDIAIANIGDKPLEDISVKLEGNANQALRLDEYWTVGETKTLSAFTTTERAVLENGQTDPNSQIDNIGKIRLWADGKGEVDASLVISAKGQAPVTIKLTGKVGQPSIMSKKVPAGVKFVPYSAILQTNYAGNGYMGSDEGPSFFLKSGSLPDGVTLIERTGEIYGVPRQYGTFRFTVGIRSRYNDEEEYDSREYELVLADNTDKNVWDSSDTNYGVATPIGTEDTQQQYYYEIDLAELNGGADATKEFVSNGTYVFFEKVFIDATLLEQGVDYECDEGSTKLAMYESTLKKFNTNGRHTLAVEFRENRSSGGSSQRGTLKRTAQNYYIKGGVNPSPGGNTGTGGGGGGGGGAIAPATNPVSVPANVENGTVSVNPAQAEKGAVVTITMKPDEGYAAQMPEVLDAKGNAVTVTDAGNGTYTFTMPESAVSVKASFALQGPPDEVFADVSKTIWFYDAVKTMREHSLMTGTSATTFSPNMKMSRAMIVTVLHRLANTPSGGTVTFPDVASGQWYSNAVAWAAANGIVTGTGRGFSPNGDMTREQLAVILYRYAKTADIATEQSGDMAKFSDSGNVSDWATDAMRWAVGAGIIRGTDAGTLNPTGSASRAEVAVMMARFIDLTA